MYPKNLTSKYRITLGRIESFNKLIVRIVHREYGNQRFRLPLRMVEMRIRHTYEKQKKLRVLEAVQSRITLKII